MSNQSAIVKMLDTITAQLLSISKEVYHRTGTAPKLVIYMPRPSFKLLMEGLYEYNFINSSRCKGIIEEQSIMSFPIVETEPNDSVTSAFTIAQIHTEG